jgi:hypothetical protein
VYLPIPQQPDCATAWLEAVRRVNDEDGHEASNVIIDVADPTARAELSDPVVMLVNDFLAEGGKSIDTIANTIFPRGLYYRHGMPTFIDVFRRDVLPKVAKNDRWSGYYFDRMTGVPAPGGGAVDQLSRMIQRMKDPKNKSLNKHEIVLFDPLRDVDDSPYGGQCLSFLSFHLRSHGTGNPRTLELTAQYRNHYYIEKLLGNLIGLGRLMAFVARETGMNVGSLTIVSTRAEIDTMKRKRSEIDRLIEDCGAAAAKGAR